MIVVSDAWVGHAPEFEVKRPLRASALRMSTQSNSSQSIIPPPSNTPTTTTLTALATPVNSTKSKSSVDTPATPPPKTEKSGQLQSQPTPISTQSSNKSFGTARSVLICQPNSHPFQTRNILLEANQEVKIGRSITRNRINENNAVFDCKVLSRNHAVMWYSDGKFFIKDTGSSNGTFINNQRLSQTNAASEPFEVRSGDVVQFGVDVMENTLKEAHGCIVALLKLYLPDGNETQSSFATSSLPSHELFQLNQCIQEAVQREQILDLKLLSIQKIIDTTRKNSANNWQAMIVEDRLLSRIDILENKLQCFQKNTTDDKLREEVLRLQEDKSVYQNSAKEALRKVYQERNEAVHKLSVIERALCSSEDECSLLRDQLLKTQQQVQEVTTGLNAKESKCSELSKKLYDADRQIVHFEQQEAKIVGQLKQLTLDNLRNKKQLVEATKQNEDLLAQIKCYENTNVCEQEEEEDDVRGIYQNNGKWDVMTWLNTGIMEYQQNSKLKENANDDQTVQLTESNHNEQFLEIEKHLSVLEKQFSLNNGSPICTDENPTEMPAISDGNQNNQHCIDDNYQSSLAFLKTSIAQLKDIYAEIWSKRSSPEVESIPKEKMCEVEAKLKESGFELQAARLELETRPTYNQYQEKIKQKDDLQEELAAATVMISQLQCKLSTMDDQLNDMKKTNERCDVDIQTDIESLPPSPSPSIQKPPPLMVEESTDSMEISELCTTTAVTATTLSSPPSRCDSINMTDNDKPDVNDVGCIAVSVTSDATTMIDDHIQEIIDNEIKMITDPDVQREEELIVYKEQCAQLTDEMLRLKSLMHDLQRNNQRFSMTTLIMLLTPFVAIISYMFISPYL